MKTKWYNNFSEWRFSKVQLAFNLQRTETHPDFLLWIGSTHPIEPDIDRRLSLLRIELQHFVTAWNEYELFGRFIAQVLSLVQFWGANFNLFHNRTLSLRLDPEHSASGQLDGLVAQGIDEPERPFFFIHEYKKSYGSEGDPKGQLLIAMLAAQHLNADDLPLYGCYIAGRIWTFVYLDGTTFAESQGYDASDAGELQIIWNILHETKRRIEARVALLDES